MKYSPCLREERDLEETFSPQSDLTVSFPAAARATSGWGERNSEPGQLFFLDRVSVFLKL